MRDHNALILRASMIAVVTTIGLGPTATPYSYAASPTWPNEPAGSAVLTDWGLDQPTPTSGDVLIPGSPGWHIVDNHTPGFAQGWTVLANDSTAPLSSPSVYDFVYPQGMVEGTSPSTVYYPESGLTHQVYIGFWWRTSNPFVPGPNGTKICFQFNGGGGAGGQAYLLVQSNMTLRWTPEYPNGTVNFFPNVNTTTITKGAWHQIEILLDTTAGNLQIWLDNVLQMNYGGNINLRNSFNFDMFQFSPTFGGNTGATKTETDHYYYDHVHISVPSSTSTKPAAPTGVLLR